MPHKTPFRERGCRIKGTCRRGDAASRAGSRLTSRLRDSRDARTLGIRCRQNSAGLDLICPRIQRTACGRQAVAGSERR